MPPFGAAFRPSHGESLDRLKKVTQTGGVEPPPHLEKDDALPLGPLLREVQRLPRDLNRCRSQCGHSVCTCGTFRVPSEPRCGYGALPNEGKGAPSGSTSATDISCFGLINQWSLVDQTGDVEIPPAGRCRNPATGGNFRVIEINPLGARDEVEDGALLHLPPTQVHQAGATVDNYVLFQGNPITIMLQIICSTGTGSNWSGTGTNYDVLPASQGIGVPYNLVNIANFVSQMNTYISWLNFSNYFSTQQTALQFFQEHIFQQAQLFTFTNKSGQLDVKMVYFALPTSNYTQIDDSNIIGIPQFDASLQTGNNFVNEVDVLWDYQPIADFYVNEAIYINNVSQQQYEESAIDEVDCQFVQTRFFGQKIANRISNIVLNLYGNPLPVITVQCFSQLQPVNPGDTILLASSQTPNLLTGQRGGTVLCMCIASAPNFTDDTTSLTLYATGYSTNKKYAVWGPSGMPTYINASASQKNYAFFSQLVQGNFAVGNMSNGDAGYYWGG